MSQSPQNPTQNPTQYQTNMPPSIGYPQGQPTDFYMHQTNNIQVNQGKVLSLGKVILVAFLTAGLAAGASWAIAMGDLGRQASGFEARLQSLDLAQKQSEERLLQTNEKINQANILLEQTRKELEYHQCEAKRSEVLSIAALAYSDYMRSVADFEACNARVEARQSKNSVFGALLGAGLAAATGGSSLLLTGAGALVGHGGSSDGNCAEPPKRTEDEFVQEALRVKGLATLPTCTPPPKAASQAKPR